MCGYDSEKLRFFKQQEASEMLSSFKKNKKINFSNKNHKE